PGALSRSDTGLRESVSISSVSGRWVGGGRSQTPSPPAPLPRFGGEGGRNPCNRVSLLGLCRCQEQLTEPAQAPTRAADAPGPVGGGRDDVGEEVVLDVPPAAHDHLAIGVEDVAVAVADAVVALDRLVLAQRDVVAADEVDAVLPRPGDVVGPHL